MNKRKEPQLDKINLEISLKEYKNKSIDMYLGSSLTPEEMEIELFSSKLKGNA